MDYQKILKETPDKKNLNVTLKKSKDKGVGLFATKTIKKGDTIAYYKIQMFREKDYESPTDFVYSFEVYRKNGEIYKRLIGDIYPDSFPEPENNIPFWGPFANEPSQNQRTNADIEIDLEENYKDRNFSVPGDTMVYRLVATKIIRPQDEILWYYGRHYPRNYKVGKH